MVHLINQTIDGLKKRIKSNLEVINRNQAEIKRLLAQPNTAERKTKFDSYYNQNKELLAQNNDYINIQLTLINFIEKYRSTPVLDEANPIVDVYSITDVEEVFELTKKGMIQFDSRHPNYDDDEFIDRLMKYYESIEDYEQCQQLLDLKSNLKDH